MIYLDHAATTPVRPEVAQAMVSVLTTMYGNPSSQHAMGQCARMLVDHAREQVAKAIHAEPRQIIFTSSGSEANSMVISKFHRVGNRNGIVTTAIEHSSILDACEQMKWEYEIETQYVQPDADGIVNINDVLGKASRGVRLISASMVNNETGALQPQIGYGRVLREQNILWHIDAIAAMSVVPVSMKTLAPDFATFSPHKFGGPKGVGVLYIRDKNTISPFVAGNQEFGLRGGTENVMGIVGAGVAFELAAEERAKKSQHLDVLTLTLRDHLQRNVNDIQFNTPIGQNRPGILNFSVPKCDHEALLLMLNARGIMCSAGSACAQGRKSHVITAMREAAGQYNYGSVRMSMGMQTEEEMIDVAKAVGEIVKQLRGEK